MVATFVGQGSIQYNPPTISSVQLVYNGSVLGTAKSGVVGNNDLPFSVPTEEIWGSSGDTWGASLTQAIVTSPTFGFQVIPENGSGNSSTCTASLQNFRLTVYYTASSSSGTATPSGVTFASSVNAPTVSISATASPSGVSVASAVNAPSATAQYPATLVQVGTYLGSSSSPISETFTNPTTLGNVILVPCFVGGHTNAITGITDNKGNTYSKITSVIDSLTDDIELELWYAVDAYGGVTSVTTTFVSTGHYVQPQPFEVAGLNTGNLVQAVATAPNITCSGTAMTGPSGTTTAPSFVFAFADANNGVSAISWPFTFIDSQVAYILYAPAGSVSLTWTCGSGSADGAALAVAFNLAGGAGTATTSGVSMTSAVGTATVSAGGTVTPSGVAATFAVNTPTISSGASISVAGQTFASAVHTPAATVSISVTTAGVASTFAVGSPTPSTGMFAYPSGVTFASGVGTSSGTGTASRNASGVTFASSVGAPFAWVGVSAYAPGVSSTFAVNAPTVSAGATRVATGVSFASAVNTPVGTGSASRNASGVASTFAVGTATVQSSAVTTASGVNVTLAVGSPAAAGAANASTSGDASAFAVHAPMAAASSVISTSGTSAVFSVGSAMGSASSVIPTTGLQALFAIGKASSVSTGNSRLKYDNDLLVSFPMGVASVSVLSNSLAVVSVTSGASMTVTSVTVEQD